MKLYYVNRNPQDTGEHEVHTSECVYLPAANERIKLGYFSNPIEAVEKAKKHYENVDGCWHCSRGAHKK